MSDLEKKTEEEVQDPTSHGGVLALQAKDAEGTEKKPALDEAGLVGQITGLRESRRTDRAEAAAEVAGLKEQVQVLSDQLVGLSGSTETEKSPLELFAEENPDEQPTAEVLVEQRKFDARQVTKTQSDDLDTHLKMSHTRLRAEVDKTPLPMDVVMAFAANLTRTDKAELTNLGIARDPDVARKAYDRILERTPQLQQFKPKDTQTIETDKKGDESEVEETDPEQAGSVVDAHANAVFGL